MLSNDHFRLLFESSPVAEYLFSPSADPVILAVNDAVLQAVGRTRDSLVGRQLFEAFPASADDASGSGLDAVRASLRRVLASRTPDVLELQRYPIPVQAADGSQAYEERYWSALTTPILDASGTLVCISHRTRDVTDVWRMQEALRLGSERQEFQLQLADALRRLGSPRDIVGTALAMLAQRLAASRMMYAEIDEAAGTFVVHNEWVGPGHSSIARQVRRLDDFGPEVIALLRAGRPMVVGDVASDPSTRAHVAAYDSIGVRANLAIPLVKSGRLTNVLTIHHAQPRDWSAEDIQLATEVVERTWAAAEQARAQQALQDSERSFRDLADAVPQIIWITDNDGRNLFFNRQWHEYTGHPRGEVVTAAEVSGQFLHPDDGPPTMERFDEARRLGITFSVEHRIRGADGRYRWFLVRAEPERNTATGEITRWFGSSTDIGALKEAERALRDADRRKDEFLATLAHELRNPLAPVSNAIAILRSGRATDEVRGRMLALMERQARHLVRLVDDLLEVSRITRGKIELQLQPVDLREIAQACIDAAGSEIQQARHDVRLSLPAQPVLLQADHARIKQVADNLLNNAIKYTPAGGAIQLSVDRLDGEAVLTVRDNGVGIAADMLGHVFELFSQVNHTVGRSNGGLGIGLALVRQLVALHGGTVEVASPGAGLGSAFTVRLPLATAASRQATGTAAGPPLRETARPRRVLVIDDNRDAADTIAAAIALAGHEVEVAYDGPGGLAAADRLQPECILLDLGMPGMSGHEVARELRRRPDHRRRLIVALTGWGQQHDRTLTQQSGFDAHLVKPAPIDAVMDLLDGAGGS